MLTIGITGTSRAGKGTLAEYLVEKYGFKHYSSSEFIKDWMKYENIPLVGRDGLIKGGNEIRRLFSPDIVARSLHILAEYEGVNAVIESIRNPDEAKYIKSLSGGYIASVDAGLVTRYNRGRKVGGIKDGVTLEQFIAQEEREMNSLDSNAQNIARCIEMADFKLTNDDRYDELYQQARGMMEVIQNSGKERRF